MRDTPASFADVRIDDGGRVASAALRVAESEHMSTYRVVVEKNQGQLRQGTVWLVGPGLACTAFHVVGDRDDRQWMHEILEGVSYYLEDDGSSQIGLTPVAFDAEADLALLRCEKVGPKLVLAEYCRKTGWSARAYPGFHGKREFTVSGRVVELRNKEPARAVQLLLEQGADVAWGGISGAAVTEDQQVIAVLTNVTDNTATGWAAPVECLHWLLALVTFAAKVASSLAHDSQADVRKRCCEGVDQHRLLGIMRGQSVDPELTTQLEELVRSRPRGAHLAEAPDEPAENPTHQSSRCQEMRPGRFFCKGVLQLPVRPTAATRTTL